MRNNFTRDESLWYLFWLYGLLITILLSSIWYLVNAQEKRITEDLRTEITLSIARYYGLNRDQAILMLAIYSHELAPKKQMKTCGYFGIRKSMQPIIEHCKSDEMLFMVCAGLCAETIKRRCKIVNKKGIALLGKRYAEDPGWANKIMKKMKLYEDIFY